LRGYVKCLKSGYEPKTINSIDLQIFTDLAADLIESKRPTDALEYITLAKQYKPLVLRDEIMEFAAVHFYEMLAYKKARSRSQLKQACHETLNFLESLTGCPPGTRLVNAEGLKSIEQFARYNLGIQPDLFAEPLARRSERKYGRNERISVRYNDGSIKKDVKFKKVEADLAENRCTLVEG
jgi:hypothetical protein